MYSQEAYSLRYFAVRGGSFRRVPQPRSPPGRGDPDFSELAGGDEHARFEGSDPFIIVLHGSGQALPILAKWEFMSPSRL